VEGAVVHIDIREWLVLAMYLHVHVEALLLGLEGLLAER